MRDLLANGHSEEGGDPARAAYLGMWHDSQETRIGDIPHSARPYVEVASNERTAVAEVRGRQLPDAHAGDCAGDDEALDFRRTFEDGVDLSSAAATSSRVDKYDF